MELGLKGMLMRDYGYDEKRVEKFSLGRSIRELRNKEEETLKGFIFTLESVLEYRNLIAKDLLAVDAMIRYVAGEGARSLSEKSLRYALFCVKQANYFHDHYLPMLKEEKGEK